MIAALSLETLHIRRGGRPVIRDVSCDVARQSWFGVVGANGSGKTTLLRAIAGRLPIAAGRCLIEGDDWSGNRAARAERIGFAPPIERLPASLTIRQLLELAGEDIAAQERRCAELWQALDIAPLLHRRIGECSSGMRQRAAIAIAFATALPVVILDEPFNWLDPVAAYDLRAALAGMVAEGLTLITALHDLVTLCGFCDAAIVLSDGQVTLRLNRGELRQGQRDASRFESAMIAALRR